MTRKLSSRQLAVIDEIFRGEVDEQSILDKYKVSRKLYNRWLMRLFPPSSTGESNPPFVKAPF